MRRIVLCLSLTACAPVAMPVKQVSIELPHTNYVRPVNKHLEPYHYMTPDDIRDAVVDLSTHYYAISSMSEYTQWHLVNDIAQILRKMEIAFASLKDNVNEVDERQLNNSRRILQEYDVMIKQLYDFENKFRAEHGLVDE